MKGKSRGAKSRSGRGKAARKKTARRKPAARRKKAAKRKPAARRKKAAKRKPAARRKKAARRKPAARRKKAVKRKPAARPKKAAKRKPAARPKAPRQAPARPAPAPLPAAPAPAGAEKTVEISNGYVSQMEVRIRRHADRLRWVATDGRTYTVYFPFESPFESREIVVAGSTGSGWNSATGFAGNYAYEIRSGWGEPPQTGPVVSVEE
ncbi:MAG: hypothetical protein A2W00_09310 [Candidatus Eisenbacteria bacterium RBG_16_71_46]|nr:MAG: hypothetical protein A2W00_09310 [Candidatus Eisenbacteria bacterium RBG_16_71_46]